MLPILNYNFVQSFRIFNVLITFQLYLLFRQDMRDTLLITAAKLGNKDVVLLLLHAGATIEATKKVT